MSGIRFGLKWKLGTRTKPHAIYGAVWKYFIHVITQNGIGIGVSYIFGLWIVIVVGVSRWNIRSWASDSNRVICGLVAEKPILMMCEVLYEDDVLQLINHLTFKL